MAARPTRRESWNPRSWRGGIAEIRVVPGSAQVLCGIEGGPEEILRGRIGQIAVRRPVAVVVEPQAIGRRHQALAAGSFACHANRVLQDAAAHARLDGRLPIAEHVVAAVDPRVHVLPVGHVLDFRVVDIPVRQPRAGAVVIGVHRLVLEVETNAPAQGQAFRRPRILRVDPEVVVQPVDPARQRRRIVARRGAPSSETM